MNAENTKRILKALDIVAAAFLIIGGLNWGLVGFFGFDLIAAIFGSMSLFSRFLYVLVGLSGLYQLLQVRTISRRWECKWLFKAAETPTV